MNRRDYLTWARIKAAIEAPKVVVKTKDNGERGLFAAETIYPGERFLLAPSHALLGSALLRNRAQNGRSETSEDQLILYIEEFRRFCLGQEDYEWREDDAVALYLVGCRDILSREPLSPPEEPVTATSVPTATEATGEPPIVEVTACNMDDIVDAQLEVLIHVDKAALNDEADAVSETPSLSFLFHVAMLPNSFPTLPLYYKPDELARMEGTNCHVYATRMLAQIQSDWSQLSTVLASFCQQMRPSIPLDEILTLDAYQWALCNIYSRSTDFFSNDARQRVIVPVFDMINHDFTSDVYHSLDQQGNLSVYNGASRSIQAGEEIFLSYGSFPNEKLLLIYGFCVPNNPHDAVSIYAPIPPSDPLYAIKLRILATRCGIEDIHQPHALRASRMVSFGRPSILPSSLLSVLRVVGIQTMEEILALASQESDDDEPGVAMMSVDNERSALTALQSALYGMARQLALNLISDESLQGGASLFPAAPKETLATIDEIADHETTAGRHLAGAAPEHRARDTNVSNAKILCQSEYQILQCALLELHERLMLLEGTNDRNTQQ